MSDATEAWEEYGGNLLPQQQTDDVWRAFLAGFAAGQVAALEDAAEGASVNFVFGAVQLKFADWLRTRATELSKETP